MRAIAKCVSRVAIASIFLCGVATARKFYDDDPIDRTPAPRRVENALPRKISDYYDFFLNTFARPGERHGAPKIIPAQAVNTLGEVPESSWYNKRHYWRRMTIEELVRGPGNDRGPSPDGPWEVVAAKSEGVTPGFTIRDRLGRLYLLKFDPLEYPELATSADVLVSRFFHALGYNVPENDLVWFRPDRLVVGENVELKDRLGRARKMTSRDLTELLQKVPRLADGRYRAVASLMLEGKWLGPFRYHGTRRDDPNDVVRHEHRRDLRGLSVFCAWLAHDDSRSINTLDMLVEERGLKYIKHHLIDFGSTLGSASTGLNSPRSGFEYVFEWDPAVRQFFTFGLLIPEWARARYPRFKAVGRFESEKFDAAGWVAEYPNPAFSNRLPDDAFWAAKQVMAFTDEEVRAIVKTGGYTDPGAEKWIADALIARRDKIGKAFFSAVLPLDRFAVNSGRLVFQDLAVKHRLVDAREYAVQWSAFDNETETKTALAGQTTLTVPALEERGFLAAEIRGQDPKKTVTVYVRRRNGDLEVVGIDRTW